MDENSKDILCLHAYLAFFMLKKDETDNFLMHIHNVIETMKQYNQVIFHVFRHRKPKSFVFFIINSLMHA